MTVDKGMIRRLNRLYRLCRAGEKGFEVVARNASNRGLKVVLKSYAQQRAQFANELGEEILRLGGEVSERRSFRGVVHRGRIEIRAALTIGAHNEENVCLGEAMHGENAVVKAYKECLDHDMPAETRKLIELQFEKVQKARDQVDLLRGHSGDRLVVRLFDSGTDADAAIEALKQADFDPSAIDVVDVKEVTSVYEGEGISANDALVSGAIGGGLWGIIIGAAAGVGALFIPGMGTMVADSRFGTWLAITLAGLIVGAFFGLILGFLIGHGVSEADSYLYDESVRYGTKLLQLLTNNDRAPEAARILHQVNAASRSRATNRTTSQPAEAELNRVS